jgi:hypothetical protein
VPIVDVAWLSAGDERDDGVAVEVFAPSVVDRRRPWVGVSSRDLYVSQRHAGVECGHDERGAEHVRMHGFQAGASSDCAYPPVRGPSVEALSVAATQDRAFVEFADREIDRACGARDQRDDGRLVSFADDAECAVPAFESEVLDVRSARLGDS